MGIDMSKGLEALEYIKHKLSELEFVLRHNNQKAPYIEETEWNIIEKELKVFAIIKEKKVDIWTLRLVDTVYKYNNFDCHFRTELTQEEFDLLKEVLG